MVRKLQNWRYGGPARPGSLSARAYRPGDERGILWLFHLVFREGKSLSRWRWEFLQNPYGKIITAVLEDDSAGIVGHFGGFLSRLQYRNETIPVTQGVDIMVHPAFQNRNLFGRLFREFVKTHAESGSRFIYGFTSEFVIGLFGRYFCVESRPVSQWVCDLRSPRFAHEAVRSDLTVSSISRFGPEADRLWEEIKKDFPCAIVRDSRYLNWRYGPQSDRKYTLWQAMEPASGKTLGLVVLSAAGPVGLILELLAAPQDQRVLEALLRWAVSYFRRAAKTHVLAWFPEQTELHQAANASGFRETAPPLTRTLIFPDDTLDKVFLSENFFYSLGDYDVY